MRDILITGANGFLGRALRGYVKFHGDNIISTDKSASKGIDIVWDITKKFPDNIAKPNVDVIIHCAAYVDDWARGKKIYDINVNGTKNVINTFSNVKCFIYISSASVYSYVSDDNILTENSSVGVGLLNDYSKTKLEAENIVRNDIQIPTKFVLRPHIIYGPGDTTITPRLKQAVHFGKFLVLGDGSNKISVTHIDNLCHSIYLCIQASKRGGFHLYNVADESSRNVTQLVNEFKKEQGIIADNFFIPKVIAYIIAVIMEIVFKMFNIKRAPLLTRYIVHQMTSEYLLNTTKITSEL